MLFTLLHLSKNSMLENFSETFQLILTFQDLSSKGELMAGKPGNDPSNDAESKKPTQLIDDILKLWEESQAENSRLRLEMNSLRMELESTKRQLENAFQVLLIIDSKFIS